MNSSKIVYSMEELLRMNTPACKKAPANLPPEIMINQSPKVTIKYNELQSSCRISEKSNKEEDLDPPSSSILVC